MYIRNTILVSYILICHGKFLLYIRNTILVVKILLYIRNTILVVNILISPVNILVNRERR